MACVLDVREPSILKPKEQTYYFTILGGLLISNDLSSWGNTHYPPQWRRKMFPSNSTCFDFNNFQTSTATNGSLIFTCEHGPTECHKNQIHACVIKNEANIAAVLKFVNCSLYEEYHNTSRNPTEEVSELKLICENALRLWISFNNVGARWVAIGNLCANRFWMINREGFLSWLRKRIHTVTVCVQFNEP